MRWFILLVIVALAACDKTPTEQAEKTNEQAEKPPEHSDQEKVDQWLGKLPHAALTGVLKWASEEEIRRFHDFHLDAWIEEGKRIPRAELVLRRMLERRDADLDLSPVAFAIGKVGNAESVPVLIACVDRPNTPPDMLEYMAIVALGELRDPRAVHALGSRLLPVIEPDDSVLIAILGALEKIGNEPAKEYLQRAADGADPIVAEFATELLSDSESKNGSPPN